MTGFLERNIEAPQRSPPVLNSSGHLALYKASTYSLTTHETRASTLVLDTQTGQTSELPSEGKNFVWLEPSRSVVWQTTVEGKTELWISDTQDLSAKCKVASFGSETVLFQAVELDNGDVGILLYGSKTVSQKQGWPRSTGRVFTSMPCLTFDQGVGRLQYSLMFLRISRTSQLGSESLVKYKPSTMEPSDVLSSAADLQFFPYSGSMPNISTPNCALSPWGIAFVAQDRRIDLAGRFASEAYFVSLPAPNCESFESPVHLPTADCNGWAALPVFSQNGHKLAFLRDESHNTICISRRIFVVHEVCKSLATEPLQLMDEADRKSDLFPEWVQWGSDGKRLYFLACDVGRARLFGVDVASRPCLAKRVAPIAGRSGSVMAASIKGDSSGPGRALLVETALTSPNRLFTLDLATDAFDEVPHQQIPDFGLKPEQVSEVWIESHGHKVHTFIMRPSDFDPSRTYPVALLVHGGPVASWLDVYHLYWTRPLFAEHGYVLVMPNFIGSTGYSLEFREAGWGHLAEKPYLDLEACMDHVEKHLEYVDMSRAVALGGSYGGYMMYWIAGRPLGKRFKALIAHAGGCFGNTSFYNSDLADVFPRLLTAADEEFDPRNVERTMFRSDPAQHASNWTTPMLFTHGEKDNRCPLSNSLAAFAHCQNIGVESRLVTFPDESHFILKPENNYHWYSEFLQFMDKYAGK